MKGMELWTFYTPILASVEFPSTVMVAGSHKGTHSVKCTIYGNFSRVPKNKKEEWLPKAKSHTQVQEV